jgi:hypothetical protein
MAVQVKLRDKITGDPSLALSARGKLFALYQGTTSVVPLPARMVRALAPAALYGTTKVVP